MSEIANHLATVKTDPLPVSTRSVEVLGAPDEKDRVQEIIALYDEITGNLASALEKAIKIGQLLTIQKEISRHGKFSSWIRKNFPFTERTAQNYMKVYRHREEIESENVSVLNDAYNILKLRRKKLKKREDQEEKRHFITFSLYKEEIEILQEALNEAKDELQRDSNSAAIAHIAYQWIMFPDNV
jgi:hypothetical protein